MNRRDSLSTPLTEDLLLAELVEEYTDKVHAGEQPDWQAFLSAHPEREEELRRLLPALEMLGAAGRSSAEPAEREDGEAELFQDTGGILGDFRVIREIGRGGMGIVYEAEQLSLKRRIALKVLPFVAMLNPRQLQRFHNEARAAACLHHNHIVPVFAVGCERGIHFYAMQYINGQSLDRWLNRIRIGGDGEFTRSARSADSTLPEARQATDLVSEGRMHVRAVVKLGIQTAQALEHAHQNGVIHRDIKPANLLVDRDGRLWITDFGLAHCQGEANNLTCTGDLLGTLRYMSPEQTLAQPGLTSHQTDIYSLGATLYELLTLKPVFTAENRQELLRQIADREPTPPRRLNPHLALELETIVLKALSKAPSDRYATAQEMAEDLERFLEDRPIQARRPGLLERLARWTRKHKAPTAAAAVTLIALVAILSISTLMYARERDLAVARQTLARTAVDEFYTRFAQEWLSQQPHLEKAQREFLNNALSVYQQFAADKGADPESRLRAAQAEHRVADIQSKLGQNDAALEAYERALAALERLNDTPGSSPEVAHELAGCWNDRGNVLHSLGQVQDAERAFRKARVLFARQLEQSQDCDWAGAGLAGSSTNLAFVLAKMEKSQEADALLGEAINIGRLWLRQQPNSPAWRHDLALALGHQASRLSGRGSREKAGQLFQEALVLRNKLVEDFPARPVYREALAALEHGRGVFFVGTGDLDLAEKSFRRALSLEEQLAHEHAGFPDYARAVAVARGRLDQVLSQTATKKSAPGISPQPPASHTDVK